VEYLEIGKDLFLISEIPIDEIEIQLKAIKPRAIIPPFRLSDEAYTFRSAEALRHRFPLQKVGIVLPRAERGRLIKLMKASHLQFEPIVFHQQIPLIQWAPSMDKHFSPNQWYHFCGLDRYVKWNYPGIWTRGDEL